MSLEHSVVILPEHPSIAGHFPGNPVVPGALLMAEISAAVAIAFPGLHVTGVRRAKFLAPARPGERLHIRLHQRSGGEMGFECGADTGPCVTGSLTVGPQ